MCPLPPFEPMRRFECGTWKTFNVTIHTSTHLVLERYIGINGLETNKCRSRPFLDSNNVLHHSFTLYELGVIPRIFSVVRAISLERSLIGGLSFLNLRDTSSCFIFSFLVGDQMLAGEKSTTWNKRAKFYVKICNRSSPSVTKPSPKEP